MTNSHTEDSSRQFPEKIRDTGRLLRSLGAGGWLCGYRYMEFIVAYIVQQQDDYPYLTKCVYPETAKHFGTTPSSVEKAVHTLIRKIWERDDHSSLDQIAGFHLEHPPKNSEFIDMVAAYLTD